jgi:serralysin
MTYVTDFTGITYASDGEPDATWNGISGLHTPVIVSYSFVEPGDIGIWQAGAPYANAGYTSFTAAQRANFRDVLALYSHAAGIVFVEAASSAGMVNVMDTSGSGWGGWANTAYSNLTYTGHGELVVDSTGNYDERSYGFLTMMHEMGHALGLQHPWEGGITLNPSVDDQLHTVMTYNNTMPYTDHLGTLDVAAVQYLYGAASATAGWSAAFALGILSVTGSALADTILGIAGQNRINGADGSDRLYGRQDADVLHGGNGNDVTSGNGGADTLFGDLGNDTLYGFGAVQDWAEGANTLYGGNGADKLYGGHANDLLNGGMGRDMLEGGRGDDTLNGGDGGDWLYGGAESDDYGRDRIYGGAGNDIIRGGAGDDTAYGGFGNDSIVGEGGQNVLCGGLGDDTLSGAAGWQDRLYGNEGNDLLQGGSQSSTLDGGIGNDTLQGGAGWDVLIGGVGNDVLIGGGGAGSSDVLTGGLGRDTFVLLASDAGGQFHLTDFTRGLDKVDLRDLQVTFGAVAFQADWFHVGTIWVETAAALQMTASDFEL